MAAAAYLFRNVACVACAPVGAVGRLVTSAAALVSVGETKVLSATATASSSSIASVASLATSASLLLLEFMANSWVKYTLLAAACVLVVLRLLVWFDGNSPPADMSMYPRAREIQKHILAQHDTLPPSSSSSSLSSSFTSPQGLSSTVPQSRKPHQQNNTPDTDLPLPPLFTPPLSTKGAHIIDATGARFKLISINYYGASDELFTPGGLDIKHRSQIARTIRRMGFNSVRLPYSDELVLQNPIIPPHLLAANADLLHPTPSTLSTTPQTHPDGGIRALDVFAAVVTALTDAGLAVILNNHITTSRWCCDASLCDAKWFNDYLPVWACPLQQSDTSWRANLLKIAAPHAQNPLVVGIDLRNEPRGPTNNLLWPSWAAAAERAGDALLALNPEWLIIVEGVCSSNDLSGVRARPVRLRTKNKLVYSSHVYGWSGWGSARPYWYRDYEGFAGAMDRNWGWVIAEGVAPVWVGEFGNPGDARSRVEEGGMRRKRPGGSVYDDDEDETSLTGGETTNLPPPSSNPSSTNSSDDPTPPPGGPSERDMNYWRNLLSYLAASDADIGYWALNPRKPHENEPEAYGLLEDDWETPRWDYRLWDLAKLAKRKKGEGGEGEEQEEAGEEENRREENAQDVFARQVTRRAGIRREVGKGDLR